MNEGGSLAPRRRRVCGLPQTLLPCPPKFSEGRVKAGNEFSIKRGQRRPKKLKGK
jgi:hypothetical protein